jgi:hypothetical protein
MLSPGWRAFLGLGACLSQLWVGRSQPVKIAVQKARHHNIMIYNEKMLLCTF